MDEFDNYDFFENSVTVNNELVRYEGYAQDITIPEGITGIHDNAFYMCESLESVTIPESVTSIGDRAFHGCGFSG